MRVAAIDVGTNSTRLLIAEARRDGYRELDRRLLFTRLGEGVDSGRRISTAAMERTLAAIAEYCSICGEFGVQRIQVAGTSAVRDAANAAQFLAAASRLAGTEAVALSGGEEASLSFAGATTDLADAGTVLVCDIGGGSTELVLGSAAAAVTGRISLELGSVRMTERFLASDPPATEEMLALEGTVDELLAHADGALGEVSSAELVGLAGTVTTLAALCAGLSSYSPGKVHLMTLDASALASTYAELSAMTVEQRSRIPVMPPGRADVILAGTAILGRIMNRWGFGRVLVSEKDLLDGLVLQMLAGSEL